MVLVLSVGDSFRQEIICPFLGGKLVCMCLLCIRTHTHTTFEELDVSLGIGTGHLESPGKIQMYWSAIIRVDHICISSTVMICTYI